MNRIDRVAGYTLGNVGSKSGVIALWIIHSTICIEPNVRNNRIQCKYENVRNQHPFLFVFANSLTPTFKYFYGIFTTVIEDRQEKYKEMLLDAAETVLGYFGFDRTLYGDKKKYSKAKMVVVRGTETRKR